jgi:hypothetical protein|tara:strand:- start:576 stop:911 length:336 start_codon:yes stop_codon:yes gene_type:complete
MISNFEDFSWDYNPLKDPYVKRSKDPCLSPSDEASYAEVIFFNQLEEALVGVVEHAGNPPTACYSSSKSLAILQDIHGLTPDAARMALSQLIDADLGPSSPCFLDTSIVED